MINGRAGNDEISAGEGSDRAIGGEGNDRMLGEDGWDHLSGDNGRYNAPMSGEDNDTFLFQFHNPVPGFDPSVGREPDNTTITERPGGRLSFPLLATGRGAREQAQRVQLDEALRVALVVHRILPEGREH